MATTSRIPDGLRIIAYFSMEVGLDPAIPTYSGGLGILAGVFAFSLAAGTLAGGAVADHSGLGMLPRWTLVLQLVCLAGVISSIKMFRVLSVESGKRSPSARVAPNFRG